MTSPTDISVVLGTVNRIGFLKRALKSIPEACGKYSSEIIVVDGGSTDGTLELLTNIQLSMPLTVIRQGARLGAVRAFNAGFAQAQGEFVAAFNDDAEYKGQPLARAVEYLRGDSNIGQIAIPYLRCMVDAADLIPEQIIGSPIIQEVHLPVIGKVPYANFSMIRRRLGEQLGWWGDYYQYAGDTELSTKVWAEGLRVVALQGDADYVLHYEAQDAIRVPNVEAPQFNARWRSPTSPFYKMAPAVYEVPVRRQAVRLRYLGKRHGAILYQRNKASRVYTVSAGKAVFLADAQDATWLLGLQERGTKIFQLIS